MSAHLGDDAALYALGLLSEPESTQAERHLECCEACRRLVAQFESDVTEIAAVQPQLEIPVQLARRLEGTSRAPAARPVLRAPWYTAVAAAFVVALLPSAYFYQENRRMHAAMVSDTEMMGRIASPHRTATFQGNGPAARVMYGPDGSWYVVVVHSANGPVHVMWPHDGVETDLGQAEPRGDVAVLYLPRSHPMRELALASGGQVVSQARLGF
jgi:anti-sigma factor RsiW